MIEETFKDILQMEKPSIVLHQVNALGYGSTGLMNRIRREHPDLFKQYHELCGWFKSPARFQDEIIGKFQAMYFPDSQNILCNAFSQRFYTETKYGIDLNAWKLILKKIVSQVNWYSKQNHVLYEVHAPGKIGIGMKSEEIQLLKDAVEELFSDSIIKFVYHF